MTGRNIEFQRQAAFGVRGQSGTITAVVNALGHANIELGENGSIIPRPKGKR